MGNHSNVNNKGGIIDGSPVNACKSTTSSVHQNHDPEFRGPSTATGTIKHSALPPEDRCDLGESLAILARLMAYQPALSGDWAEQSFDPATTTFPPPPPQPDFTAANDVLAMIIEITDPSAVPKHSWMYDAAARINHTLPAADLALRRRTKLSSNPSSTPKSTPYNSAKGMINKAEFRVSRALRDETTNFPMLAALIPDDVLRSHVFGAGYAEVGPWKETLLLEAGFVVIRELEARLGMPEKERVVNDALPSGVMPMVLQGGTGAGRVDAGGGGLAADDGFAVGRDDERLADAGAEGILDHPEDNQSTAVGLAFASPVLGDEKDSSPAADPKAIASSAYKVKAQLRRKWGEVAQNRAYWALEGLVPESVKMSVPRTVGDAVGRVCIMAATYIKDLQGEIKVIEDGENCAENIDE